MEEIEIWPCWQMVYAQTKIRSRKWDPQNSVGFWGILADYLIPAKRLDQELINLKKQLILWILPFLTHQRREKNESCKILGPCKKPKQEKKKIKKKRKKLWSLKVAVILIVIGALQMVPRGMGKKWRN